MKKLSTILCTLVGVIFLISGYAKSGDSAYFSNLLTYYGAIGMGWLALAIIPIELALGWLLVLQIHRRVVALISATFLLCVSLGFAYGIIFHGVYNCGCFGHLDILNFGPAGTFIRNALLLGALGIVAWQSDREGRWAMWKTALLALGLTVGGVICGLTFGTSDVWAARKYKFLMQPLEQTALKDYIHTDYDSTYLVFAFSYSCPHCNQSMGNVALCAQTQVVDHVIGLALEDSTEESAFRAFYPADMFPIHNLSMEQIIALTDNKLPMAYWIRHDSVLLVSHGEMLPPRLLDGFNRLK